ncbi:MAG: helix-turn-helix domain-containing protein [[Eubacterium] sulci]|nr:helix-turn-helix domain-containing protein [[Eubacterium] sulci]
MSTQLGNKDIMARNIQYYMDLTGKSRNDMCEALNIKYTTFTDWVKGNTYPRIDSIEKMANYFGIEKSDLIEEHPSDPTEGITNLIYPAARPIPILGTICAGNGVWCEDNFEGYFYIDKSIKADMCLEVKGDSMIDANIFDGDIAFIKKTYDYQNGKIYAVVINDENSAVLKKVHWSNGSVILNPCNSEADYEPIATTEDNVTMVGECVGVYRATK